MRLADRERSRHRCPLWVICRHQSVEACPPLNADRDHFWAELDDHDPSSLDLERVPREKDSTACWTGSFTEPIDFIAFNERAAPAIQAGTYVKSGFTQYEDVYKDLDESTVSDGAGHRNRMLISDHCLNAWNSTSRG